jgi:anaerobic magnesium-protoporphyrin IX monomethyl ester cyclase
VENGAVIDRNRVALLNPPAPPGMRLIREGRCMHRTGAWTTIWAPISLTGSAAVLEQRGFEVKIWDCVVENVDTPRLRQDLLDFQPGLVVVNTGTPSIENDLGIAAQIKSWLPEAAVGAMGIHVSVLPAESLQTEPSLDFMVRREPEYTIRDLALAVRNGEDLGGVLGLSYQRDGQVRHNKDRGMIENLDDLPFPAWHLINPDHYRLPFSGRRFLLVSPSRGCPWHCLYCVNKPYHGGRLRQRSVGNVVDEIQWLTERHGVDEFLFWTESFTLDRDFAMAVCDEIIARGLKVGWVCNSRVDQVDRELLQKLHEAGCWMIGYGIESGNQRILDLIPKGSTLRQSRDAVRWAKEAGLQVTAHCVLGFPGETVGTMADTIDFAVDLDVDFAQFYCVVPLPGTPLYRIAERNGWLSSTDWRFFEQNSSVLCTETLTPEQVMEWRERAYRRFYLRPRAVVKTMWRLRSMAELNNFVRMVRDFATWVIRG